MNPYAIIAGLAVAIGLTLGGVQVGRKLERTAWQAKEIKILAAAGAARDKSVVDNEALRRSYAAEMRVASENHANEIAALNARHAADQSKRVRVPAAFCQPASTANTASQGASTRGVEQTPADAWFLPDAFAGDLRRLVHDADVQLADYRQLVVATKAAGCFMGYD